MSKLTLGIISYNRPSELKRCLESILPVPYNVDVLVCDDNSPRSLEICDVVNAFQVSNKNIKVVLKVNEINYGYDKNLFNILELADSEYVLLLGDDDMLEPNALFSIMETINRNNFSVGFLRVRFSDNLLANLGIKEISYDRNYFKLKYFPPAELRNNGFHLYNSILFSGLIFKKESVLEFKNIIVEYYNSIYIQVAIFCFLSNKYGSYFIPGPGIMIGSDGENGFGLNESASDRDKNLIDRSHFLSNLNYQVRLKEIIERIAKETSSEILKSFLKEYKIRYIKFAWTARKKGRKGLLEFLKYSKKLGLINVSYVNYLLLIFYIIPIDLLNIILSTTEKAIHKFRKNKNIK